MKVYRLIGWYSNIPANKRSSINISDGAIFSTQKLACDYAIEKNMTVSRMEIIEKNPNDPEIDHLIKSGVWKPVTLT